MLENCVIHNPKELVHCKEYQRKEFTVIQSDGKVIHKNLVILRYDGADFFRMEGLANGEGVNAYDVEMIDYVKLFLDWNKEEERIPYEFCAGNMAGRLIHKKTGKKIYGFFEVKGNIRLYYEKGGYFYPGANVGDYDRQYINPIYYPSQDCVLKFHREEDLETDKVAVGVIKHTLYGKIFLGDVESGKDKRSFFAVKKWWEKSETIVNQAREEFCQKKYDIKEGTALVEEVIWQQESSDGNYEKNQCKMRMKVVLPEYTFDCRKRSSYKGIYQVEDVWEVEIGDFLRILDPENKGTGSDQPLRDKMYSYAKLLKGETFSVFCHQVGVGMKHGELYLDMMLAIPELFIAIEQVARKVKLDNRWGIRTWVPAQKVKTMQK